ncbi:MAG: 30S ribosomal protein S17 [Planctomycetes bacterium RBG_16_43_13]|nr:MAG: 30S ribosomal protein S17 [Planctomycetes bacterium RBG_16_43_13]
MLDRGRRRTVVGVVTSDKMQKTITVSIERIVTHPKFGKRIKRYTICKAHDESREAKTGDKVELMETRPLSKTKCWRLTKILEKATDKA